MQQNIELPHPTIEPHESSVEFMLKEYERVYTLRNSEDQQGEQRVNFFITLATATIAALLLFFQNAGGPNPLYSFVTIGVLIVLLLFGIVTLSRLAMRTVQQQVYWATLAQIRDYFAKHDAEIANYLTFYQTLFKPKLGSKLTDEIQDRMRGSLVDLMILFDGLICGGITLASLVNLISSVEWVVVITLIVVLVSLVVFDVYYNLLKRIVKPFKF